VEHGHPKPPEPLQRSVPVGPARPGLRPRADHGISGLHHPSDRRPAPARAGPVCTNQLGAMPRASDSPAGTLSTCASVFGGACEAFWVFVRGLEFVYLVSDKCAVVTDGQECLVLDGPVMTVAIELPPLAKKYGS
jgi:hypothetical protein